jgi:hypothetical protein
MRRSILRGSVASLSLTVMVTSAAAYTPAPSKWNPSSLPIGYRVNGASAPSSIGAAGATSAVDMAFATWAAPACTAWRSQNLGTTAMTRARSGDSERSILWIQGPRGSWPAELGSESSTIGVTTPVWRSGGYFIDADIQFNAVGFTWGAGASGTVDTQTIALHEEGHFLGLDHTGVRAAVMFASYSGGQNRSLNADDQAGVCFLYPSGSAPPPPPVDAGSSTPPGGGAVGAVCNAMNPCAAGNSCVCRSASDCFCSRSCSASSPCPTGFQCANTNIGSLCVPGGGGMMMMGAGRTGDPCSAPDQCSSGLCVRGPSGNAFCSQACTDDCSCPTSFSCFMTSMAGLSVCGPGTNGCSPSTSDAGGVVPLDAGGGPPPEETDAAAPDPAMDGGAADGGRTTIQEAGCRCAAPGSSGRGSASGRWALLGAGGALAALRRRRAQPRL